MNRENSQPDVINELGQILSDKKESNNSSSHTITSSDLSRDIQPAGMSFQLKNQ